MVSIAMQRQGGSVRLRLYCVLALAPLLAADFVQGQAREPTLRVAMDTRIPPWSFVPGLDYSREDPYQAPAVTEAQLRKAEGLEVDVANAIARRLGATLHIVAVSWFDLEQSLVGNRADLIVNAWTPNRRTPAGIVATEGYYTWGLLTAVSADDTSVRSSAELTGRVVGCFRSVIVDRTLYALNARELRPYDLQERLFDDLKARKLDAAVYDSPYVRWRAAREPWLRTVGEPLNKLKYHVGLRRSDAALVAKVQAAVKDIVASGEAERIRRKWEEAPRR